MTALAEAPTRDRSAQLILDLAMFEGGPTDEQIRTHGWMAYSACREDPDLMFPEKDDEEGQQASRDVCWLCPANIRGICRIEKADQEFGTVAGETEWDRKKRKNAERQRARRAKQRAAA